MGPRGQTTEEGSAAPDIASAMALRGYLTFAEFQELALYGPHGFYIRGGGAGRRRDYLTSPEMGGLFAEVVSRYLDSLWDSLGCPDPFVVVDAGAGPGGLCRGLARSPSRSRSVTQFVLIEISAELRKLHPTGAQIVSQPELPERAHCVIAHELLDNIPVGLEYVADDGLVAELVVCGDGDSLRLGMLASRSDRETCAEAIDGENPLSRARPTYGRARTWIDRARSRLYPGGELLAIDYGSHTRAELVGHAFLRTYRGHRRAFDVLHTPGDCDITCDIAVDQLPRPDHVLTQAEFLRSHGIDELVTAGRDQWEANAGAPTLDDFRARSAAVEARALTDPSGFGNFLVMQWRASPQ